MAGMPFKLHFKGLLN